MKTATAGLFVLSLGLIVQALGPMTEGRQDETVDNRRVASIRQQDQQGGKVCPDGWTPFEGHCYLVGVTDVTQEDAEKDCMSKGGHLASVHSEDENTFIHNLHNLQIGLGFWLGATDADDEVIINKLLHNKYNVCSANSNC